MRKLNLWAVILIALVAFASCGQALKAEKKQIAAHVIYIGLDGWGSYSVDSAWKARKYG